MAATVYTSNYASGNIGFGESGRRKVWTGTIAYTAVTYGANGLPILAGSMGFTTTIESLVILSSPNTTDQYRWDATNSTLRRYVEGVAVYVETSGSQTISVLVQATGW